MGATECTLRLRTADLTGCEGNEAIEQLVHKELLRYTGCEHLDGVQS